MKRTLLTNHIGLLSLLICMLILVATLISQQTESSHLKRSHIRAIKKVAVAATALGNRKKFVIPLPIPLPLPIPIIQKREPIISPIDPLLTIVAAKGGKGYYPHYSPGYGGLHGGGFGGGYGRR